ncbi:GumC family protein [Capnocytophaga canis]|uniref:GumC family protein n=1 Tax=Capnocytophaga canis TaxID=1848903 RepID=UPI001562D15A|nr:polysaccharide biosynthesis tyrosine autokinase [Capnocytophaga canis]
MENQLSFNEKDEKIDFSKIIQPYLSRWLWFAISVVVAFIFAYAYLRYAPSIYRATTTVMLKDDKKGGVVNELSALSDLDILKDIKDNIENQIEVLKSRTLSEKVVQKLNLHISYISEGKVKTFDVYNNTPAFISIETLVQSSVKLKVVGEENEFTLFEDEQPLGTFRYGEIIQNHIGQFSIHKSAENTKFPYSIGIDIEDPIRVASGYRSSLNIKLVGKNTSVLELSVSHQNKKKAEDYLNALVEIYNTETITDQRFISQNTSDFLTKRLEVLTKELHEVEKHAEIFKKENRVTNIQTDAQFNLENANLFDRKYVEATTQIELIENTIKGFIDVKSTGKTFPLLDVFTSNQVLSAAIEEHNKKTIHRNQIALNAGEGNIMLKQIEEEIEDLKITIKENLLLMKSNLLIQKNEISKKQASLSGRVRTIPTLEKELREITRQQSVKESLFLYLLEKREEAEISMAALAPKAKVIDRALGGATPISPRPMIILLGAIVLGCIIPFLVIYIMELFNIKVRSKSDVEERLSLPFIGQIPHTDDTQQIVTLDTLSPLAEGFQMVCTNMDFVLNDTPQGQSKTILVTSSFPEEGKTFVSVNLAATFAVSGKKTLLIGMDIRNPKIGEQLNLRSVGLTNYLASDIDLSSVIVKIPNFREFYVLPTKVIPPNPAELLTSSKITKMFEQLKQEFDYIIVDTAPVNVVADTLLIAKYADACVYVIRENFSDKRMLESVQRLYDDKRLPNMAVVLNDVSLGNMTPYYGYNYGYGYGAKNQKNKSPFKKILHKFRW